MFMKTSQTYLFEKCSLSLTLRQTQGRLSGPHLGSGVCSAHFR